MTFFDLDRVLLFTLLLARASGLVAASPFFGERTVPTKVKALLVATLGFLMLMIVPGTPARPETLFDLGLLVAAEIALGLAMGFVARLVIMAFEMAGQIIAIQMGFGMAQIMDPLQGYRSNLMGRWMWLVGTTFFLLFNGHHHLLRALAGSLELVPPGSGFFRDAVVHGMVRFSADSFPTALSIAAPAIGILLLTSTGLGILARAVPQMNVFIVGFPLKITAGIMAVLLSLPYLVEVARREVGNLATRLADLILAA
jgi:flagellar biosynthetic protein FliR